MFKLRIGRLKIYKLNFRLYLQQETTRTLLSKCKPPSLLKSTSSRVSWTSKKRRMRKIKQIRSSCPNRWSRIWSKILKSWNTSSGLRSITWKVRLNTKCRKNSQTHSKLKVNSNRCKVKINCCRRRRHPCRENFRRSINQALDNWGNWSRSWLRPKNVWLRRTNRDRRRRRLYKKWQTKCNRRWFNNSNRASQRFSSFRKKRIFLSKKLVRWKLTPSLKWTL